MQHCNAASGEHASVAHESLNGRVLRSFWSAGFESACHINRSLCRLDMVAITQHDLHVREDYARLQEFNLRTVREAVRWHLVDHGGRYDFGTLKPMAHAATEFGLQVIWTLFHYGWPDDLELLSPKFVDRFARLARAAARFLHDHTPGPLVVTPVNEMSFFAYAAGKEGCMHPFLCGRGREIKQQLVRASIAASEAVWSVDPAARLVHAEPLVHVVPPRHAPELWIEADAERQAQFEAWDMLVGRIDPHLGGDPKYLDIAGVNFYASNQWDPCGAFIMWHVEPRDPRWRPLRWLLQEVHRRYDRPLMLSETSHVGVGRAAWLREIADEVAQAIALGVPIHSICLYPILDRPDWDKLDHWHNSGLWDLKPDGQGKLTRVLHEEYAQALREAQRLLPP